MSFEQQDLYDDLLAQLAKNVEDGSSGKDSKGASMMMALRKAANHHLLHRRQFDDSKLKYMAELLVEASTFLCWPVGMIMAMMMISYSFVSGRLLRQL